MAKFQKHTYFYPGAGGSGGLVHIGVEDLNTGGTLPLCGHNGENMHKRKTIDEHVNLCPTCTTHFKAHLASASSLVDSW